MKTYDGVPSLGYKKIIITGDDMTEASTTQLFHLLTPAAGKEYVVWGLTMRTRTEFTGQAAHLGCSIGDTVAGGGSATHFVATSATNLSTKAGISTYTTIGGGDDDSTGTITMTVTSSDGNVAACTAGQCEIHILYSVRPYTLVDNVAQP